MYGQLSRTKYLYLLLFCLNLHINFLSSHHESSLSAKTDHLPHHLFIMNVNWTCCRCHWVTAYRSMVQHCDGCGHLFCEYCEFFNTCQLTKTPSEARCQGPSTVPNNVKSLVCTGTEKLVDGPGESWEYGSHGSDLR